jgi:lipooligosaccharide transport system ATP-binding protein
VIWGKLRQLRVQGTTILLTTHYMEEAFQICDQVLIMDKGRAVLQDRPRSLLAENIEPYVLEVPVAHGAPDIHEADLPDEVRVDRAEGTVRFYATHSDLLKDIADRLSGDHYHLRESTLEDVFLKTTGRALNEKQ